MNRIVTGLRNTALLISMCIFASTPLTIYGAETGTTAAPAAATTAAAPAATTATAATEAAAATTTAAPAATTATAGTEAAAATTAAAPAATTPTEEAAQTGTTASTEAPAAAQAAAQAAPTEEAPAGEDSGASGNGLSEKKVTLIIGKALMKELQKYDNVLVGMTRDKDKEVGLHKRTKIARKKKADIMISLHCDAYDSSCLYDHGSSVLVARKGKYKTELVQEENRLARSILAELEGLGLTIQGLVRRASVEGDRYEDGSIADYYGIIRDGMLYDFPVILVEHCFMDSKKDYQLVLSSKEKIQELAAADARGIAKYLGLKKKDTGEVEQANVRRGKELTCTGKEDSYFSLQKKVYYINAKRELETIIADARAELDSMEAAVDTTETVTSTESTQQGNVDNGTASTSQTQTGEQGSISRIQSTPQQDQATESLAISFGLALLAYYGLVTLSEKNRRMHG